MNSGKKISLLWNKLLCFLFGHTLTTICTRCGKLVDLEGTKRPSLEDRINSWWANRGKTKVYKGSLKVNHNLRKYSINLKTNELREVDLKVSERVGPNGHIKTHYEATYDPYCVYIDALNDDVAIRKANTVLLGLKKGIRIKHITRGEKFESITCL